MGTWATDPFGNDTACDWAAGIVSTRGTSTLLKTLRAVDTCEYLDARQAEEAIAAADTVARLGGQTALRNAYTAKVDGWVTQQKYPPTRELIDAALGAVHRVFTAPSELLELWEENTEDGPRWKQELSELKQRLTAVNPAPKRWWRLGR